MTSGSLFDHSKRLPHLRPSEDSSRGQYIRHTERNVESGPMEDHVDEGDDEDDDPIALKDGDWIGVYQDAAPSLAPMKQHLAAPGTSSSAVSDDPSTVIDVLPTFGNDDEVNFVPPSDDEELEALIEEKGRDWYERILAKTSGNLSSEIGNQVNKTYGLEGADCEKASGLVSNTTAIEAHSIRRASEVPINPLRSATGLLLPVSEDLPTPPAPSRPLQPLSYPSATASEDDVNRPKPKKRIRLSEPSEITLREGIAKHAVIPGQSPSLQDDLEEMVSDLPLPVPIPVPTLSSISVPTVARMTASPNRDVGRDMGLDMEVAGDYLMEVSSSPPSPQASQPPSSPLSELSGHVSDYGISQVPILSRSEQAFAEESQDPLALLPSSPTIRRASRAVYERRSRSRSTTPVAPIVMAPRPLSPTHAASPPVPQLPPAILLDPALQDFQSTRTFRKRTALQLQPYTREKEKYTSIVRRGGRRLIQELMHDDPDQVALQIQRQQAEQDSQFVEGESLEKGEEDETLLDMSISPPVTPLNCDKEAYLKLYGEAAVNDLDERLQRLAKQRLKEEEREKKRKAKQERLEQKFQLELERKAREKRKEEKAKKKVERDAKRQAALDASTNDGPPGSSNMGGVPGHARKKATNPRERDLEAAREALAHLDRHQSISSLSPSPEPWLNDNDDGIMDLDMDMDVEMDLDVADSESPEVSGTRSLRSGNESPPVPVAPKKAKLLRKVLPAFMIRSLAAAEQRKIAAERQAKAYARRSHSPQRGAGVARIRKAGRHISDRREMDEFFVEQPDEDEVVDNPPLDIFGDEIEIPVAPNYDGVPPISDDESTNGSSSSESEEDGTESVRLLVEGNFTRLLDGKRKSPTKRKKSFGPRLLRTALEPKRTRKRPLTQTRLNFDSTSHNRKERPTRAPRPTRLHPRLLLDDESIFQTSSHQREPHPRKLTAAPFRTVSPITPGPGRAPNPRPILPDTPSTVARGSSPIPHRRQPSVPTMFAATPHKASLWSDDYDFQVDFDVKPLPSAVDAGLSFPVPRLTSLLGWLDHPSLLPVNENTIEMYSLSMFTAMDEQSLLSALQIASECATAQLLEAANDRLKASELHICQLLDFADVLFRTDIHIDSKQKFFAVLDPLFEACLSATVVRDSKKDAFASSVLEAKWNVLQLFIEMERLTHGLDASGKLPHRSVEDAARTLVVSLLDYGFDRTMKPLKRIMAGTAQDGYIASSSVGIWIALMHVLSARLRVLECHVETDPVFDLLKQILQEDGSVRHCEKIWYLIFGTAAISQFGPNGQTGMEMISKPAWPLVRAALRSIALPPMSEEEEIKRRYELKGRDKYIKITVMRCLQLNCIWQWQTDRTSFPIATKDLGAIFRDRHHRNLPNENSSDFPEFIVQMDQSKAEDLDYDDSAYNLYLRFVCLSASDMVERAGNLSEAKDVEKEVQRLMLAVFPASAVSSQQTLRQITALINRYSTIIVAALFVPSLMEWLLSNSSKWMTFANADVAARSICIRGLMYMGVVARHHQVDLQPVVSRLATIFDSISTEKTMLRADDPDLKIKSIQLERQLILVITSFRYMIKFHSFHREMQEQPRYPDPILLHPVWTNRLQSRELVTDKRSGNEIVDCIQTFLDARNRALPDSIKSQRHALKASDESQSSEFSAMGIDFTDEDLFALGGSAPSEESVKDGELARIIRDRVSPGLYEMLSNTLSNKAVVPLASIGRRDQAAYVAKLTKCWADCAVILVVDHHLRDWSTYVGYGKESWERLAEDVGRKQVGLHFMRNLAQLDPNSFLVSSDPHLDSWHLAEPTQLTGSLFAAVC